MSTQEDDASVGKGEREGMKDGRRKRHVAAPEEAASTSAAVSQRSKGVVCKAGKQRRGRGEGRRE